MSLDTIRVDIQHELIAHDLKLSVERCYALLSGKYSQSGNARLLEELNVVNQRGELKQLLSDSKAYLTKSRRIAFPEITEGELGNIAKLLGSYADNLEDMKLSRNIEIEVGPVIVIRDKTANKTYSIEDFKSDGKKGGKKRRLKVVDKD